MFNRIWLILLVAITLLPAGCARYSGESVSTTTLTLTESDINEQVTNILQNNAQLPINNATTDLQPGQIVVNGDVEAGRQSAPIDITIELGTENGDITANVTNATLGGNTMPDNVINQFNEALAARLAERANADNRNVVSVTITDNDVQFTVEADGS